MGKKYFSKTIKDYKNYDAIIICTAHDSLNKKILYKKSKLIFDTRGIYKNYSSKKLFNYNLSVFKNLKFTLFTNNSRGLSTYNYLKKRGININKILISKKNLDKKIFNELKRRKVKDKYY